MALSMKAPGWENIEDIFSYQDVMDKKKRARAEDGGGGAVATKKATWEIIKPQSRIEEEELSDEEVDTCYGCENEDETAAMDMEEFSGLWTMIRDKISTCHFPLFCKKVSKAYEEIRVRVNDRLQPHEKPLPPWPPKKVAEHFRSHPLDPELTDLLAIRDLKEWKEVAAHAMKIQNSETGEVKLDEKQAKLWLDLDARLEIRYKSKPDGKNYFSGGKIVDVKAASEGPMSFSGRNLSTFLKKKK
jgi:hypothetical protein